MDRYNNYEVTRKDAATRSLIDCLISCEVFDMSALLRSVNDMPFLSGKSGILSEIVRRSAYNMMF